MRQPGEAAPKEVLRHSPREAWPLARVLSLVLMKMGHAGPPLEPRRRPQAGKSGDPRSQNADSVECHTTFTTPYARYAWIVLHLTHVFRHFILFGVYAYDRPLIERFAHACYDFEVDAYFLVTHICITTSHLHACPHDIFACA